MHRIGQSGQCLAKEYADSSFRYQAAQRSVLGVVRPCCRLDEMHFRHAAFTRKTAELSFLMSGMESSLRWIIAVNAGQKTG